MVTPVVEARRLSRRYGAVRAVDRLDLEVRQGEVYGLLGLNGAGKTTTLQMLCGVLPPSDGIARVLGTTIRPGAVRVPRGLAVVFGENVAPEPTWSTARYLRHFGRLHGLDAAMFAHRVAVLLKGLGLQEIVDRPIARLSGGNRRKVELARALLPGPRLLVLDEPTRELDLPAKRRVWRFLRRLGADGSITVFLSSHDPEEIAQMCTRMGVLSRGRIRWQGTPQDLAPHGGGFADALGDLLEGRSAPSRAQTTPGPAPERRAGG